MTRGIGFFVADVVLVDVGLVVGLRRGVVVGGFGVEIGDLGLLLPAAALRTHDGLEIGGPAVLGNEVGLLGFGRLGVGFGPGSPGQSPVEVGQALGDRADRSCGDDEEGEESEQHEQRHGHVDGGGGRQR
jgi:hypothetical protein